MTEQLKAHIADMTKKDFDEFATEYFGVQLDRRQSRPKMEAMFFAEIEGKEPLKPLPFEELLVEEPAPKAKAAKEPKPAKVTIGEPSIDGYTLDDFPAHFTPFELVFKNGPHFYTHVHFSVTDFLEALKHGHTRVEDAPLAHKHEIVSVIYYLLKQGEVMVRESRNSCFVTYKLDDFQD